MIAALVIGLGLLFSLYLKYFSGDGMKTPEEALPTDHEYVWIKGPQTENVHRYFYLSNGKFFGTGIVTKNFKGWNTGHGVYALVPKELPYNQLTAAHSDNKIIYGFVKKDGDMHIRVNTVEATFIELTELSEETIDLYGVHGYSIWYVDFEKLEDTESFTIQLLNDQNKIISELNI